MSIPTVLEFRKTIDKRTERDVLAHVLSVIGRAMRSGRTSTTMTKPDDEIIDAVRKELHIKGFAFSVDNLGGIDHGSSFCVFKWSSE